MINGQLTAEEKDAVAKWNEHGQEVTDNALKRFVPDWFSNIRALIQSNIAIQSLNDLALQFTSKKNFIILGSGPSASDIARSLPDRDDTMVICSPTCVGALLVENRKPDVVMVADSNPQMYEIIRDLEIYGIEDWKFALPVTADKAWFLPNSIVKPSQIYFYLPFMDNMGSTDIAYNDILKALFPEVHRYICQAGSVGNAIFGFVDMICGDDPSKRVYIGVDCCSWLTNPPRMRALAAKCIISDYYEPYEIDIQKVQAKQESEDALVIPTMAFPLQTNLTSLGYAIQMLYIVHFSSLTKERENRFVFLRESVRLFSAIASECTIPSLLSCDVGNNEQPLQGKEWSYNAMLKLIAVCNKHKQNVIAKYEKGKKE